MMKMKSEKTNRYMKKSMLTLVYVLFMIVFVFQITALSETPAPEEPTPEITATPEAENTESPVETLPVTTDVPTENPTEKPSEAPTELPTTIPTDTVDSTPAVTTEEPTADVPVTTPSVTPATPTPTLTPTPTPALDYLYDFTIPPRSTENTANKTLAPNETITPTMNSATIGVVKIENIDAKDTFRWSDLIQYAAYVFFALAGAVVIYGFACLFSLLIFNKDITIGAIRKRKREKKESQEKSSK